MDECVISRLCDDITRPIKYLFSVSKRKYTENLGPNEKKLFHFSSKMNFANDITSYDDY